MEKWVVGENDSSAASGVVGETSERWLPQLHLKEYFRLDSWKPQSPQLCRRWSMAKFDFCLELKGLVEAPPAS